MEIDKFSFNVIFYAYILSQIFLSFGKIDDK